VISKFDYVYDAEGQITTQTKQLGASGFPETWTPNFGSTSMLDAADQLTNVTVHDSADTYGSISYTYDGAGNRDDHAYNIVNQISDSGYTYDNNGNLTADPSRSYEWDAANRLAAINYTALGTRTEFTYDGLSRRVKIVEKDFPMALDVNIQPPNKQYTLYGPYSFTLASAGSYKLTLQGLNPNGGDNTALLDVVKLNATLITNGGFETPNVGAGNYQFNPTGGTWLFAGTTGVTKNNTIYASSNPVAPDGNQAAILQMSGTISQSLTVPTGSNTLQLKAAQRGNINPTYQVVRLTLQSNTLTITSTKQFIWIGNSIAEERNASNVVTRRFYPQGEQISGASYFYMRDHLGSVTEMTDSTGAVRAEYYYDWWGNRTKRSGDLEASIGFTGHYYHAKSGLNLALYRAYDASTGRWISRDPIEERGGLNMYGYVRNDPLNAFDPLGLEEKMVGIVGISGTVLWMPNPGLANPHWLPAREGMIVNLSGDEMIHTGPDSRCEVEFMGGGGFMRRMGQAETLSGRPALTAITASGLIIYDPTPAPIPRIFAPKFKD
jgi:RHS repeat-associated protein